MVLVAIVMLLLAALAINILKAQLDDLKKHYIYGDKD